MSKAIEDVLAERQRQIDVEGWSVQHDDAHDSGDLCAAGAAYAIHAADSLSPLSQGDGGSEVPVCWPQWPMRWWKPKSPRQDLFRAAALMIAEIERLDREEARLLQGA